MHHPKNKNLKAFEDYSSSELIWKVQTTKEEEIVYVISYHNVFNIVHYYRPVVHNIFFDALPR